MEKAKVCLQYEDIMAKTCTTRLTDLKQLMKKLRDPLDGCAWDREQTSETLTKYLIEECYEVVAAIENGTQNELLEELGDLLLQIIFQAQIAEERELFSLDDIIDTIYNKLIHRHPHIFGTTKFKLSAKEQAQNWNRIKAEERSKKTPAAESLLHDISDSLPAIQKSLKIQNRVAEIGFDWDNYTDVIKKIYEEINELSEAIDLENEENITDEFGDILFTLINLSRHIKIDPETALRNANKKFAIRFSKLEELLKAEKTSFTDLSFKEMNSYWLLAKQKV